MPLQRPAKPVSRVKRPRVDGHNHCPICGELGHNRMFHDSSSASMQGAQLARDGGLSFRQAAALIGLTAQAVQQAYRRRFGDGETPKRTSIDARAARIVELVQSGLSSDEIAVEVGLKRGAVLAILKQRGLRARDDRPRISEDDLDRAMALIGNGDSYMEAAAVIGRSAQRLADLLRARGVASKAANGVRMDGRTNRAIERVERGESIVAACRAERCAMTSVYVHFKRLRGAR